MECKSFYLSILLLLLLNSCSINLGGSNEFHFDYNNNQIVSKKKTFGRVHIEGNNPTVYYSYHRLPNKKGSSSINIFNPNKENYEFYVDKYSEDTDAYKSQSFILRPNTKYTITNSTNGDGKPYSVEIETDSFNQIIKP